MNRVLNAIYQGTLAVTASAGMTAVLTGGEDHAILFALAFGAVVVGATYAGSLYNDRKSVTAN